MHLLHLLFKPEALFPILDSGDNWKVNEEAKKGLMACVDSGWSIGETLFSGCLDAVLVTKLKETMAAGIDRMRKHKPLKGATFTKLDMQKNIELICTDVMGLTGSTYTPITPGN